MTHAFHIVSLWFCLAITVLPSKVVFTHFLTLSVSLSFSVHICVRDVQFDHVVKIVSCVKFAHCLFIDWLNLTDYWLKRVVLPKNAVIWNCDIGSLQLHCIEWKTFCFHIYLRFCFVFCFILLVNSETLARYSRYFDLCT